MRAKARQLRVELRSTKLQDRSIQEYLLRIRLLIDDLIAIGDLVPLNHHLDVILEGLPLDFNSVIFVIECRFDTMDLDEALLLAHEERLEKSKKKTLDDVASLSLAQASSSKSTPNSNSVSTHPSVNSTTAPDSSYFNSNRGRGSQNGRRGRGRSGGGARYSNVQCQICFKTGHPAFDCWHRSNLQYQPPMNAQYQAGYGAYQANFGQNLGGYGAM
jgi:hypothetical protein